MRIEYINFSEYINQSGIEYISQSGIFCRENDDLDSVLSQPLELACLIKHQAFSAT